MATRCQADARGIAVLRGPARMSEEALHRLLSTFASALETQPFQGALWIVEEGRILVFDPPV